MDGSLTEELFSDFDLELKASDHRNIKRPEKREEMKKKKKKEML